MSTRTAVVTGASTGIGRATALVLAEAGFTVYAVARREDRLAALAEENAAIRPKALDITDEQAVAALAAEVAEAGGAECLVNISGGARGTERVAEAVTEDWDWMLRVNVLGTMTMTRAFLPQLRQGRGTVLNLTSTAAIVGYEGGAGYNAAKFAERGFTRALRLEEAEHDVRVIELLPGMVRTEEFSLMRMHGDQAAADKVYEGVAEPLTAEDVADVIRYAVTVPHHVSLDEIVLRPVAQAAQHKVIRRL
ncbi:SDR family oxidoreductase [Falsarthrobacter nasiphocae]|uniref:NADP-dependent 3-hydroxy acid dehydrogenase YdfG n=1 Tax=Falsarthrobacter nasiphocae TaxID=189863 RepID=A0AAE3YIS5_9MICC|nr:SDR family oxidoreductase [Falsarthrobacter nasiphocae]MDR6892924.1 NADP-dependent 3-hydroxy acid dehydrogenase YdfG [Falsarthrobacter nasiphocae]